MFAGRPGTGKTMIARRLAGILPPLNIEESLEVARIYSVAGIAVKGDLRRLARPFRAPHHTITQAGLIGGGRRPKPGELSLAHHGILFLDELTEFKREVLEVLRQPMEDRGIVIVRAQGSYSFPAQSMIVAAMNLCPCGNFPDLGNCTCTTYTIRQYLQKLSQPFLDRFDISGMTDGVDFDELVREPEEPKKRSSGTDDERWSTTGMQKWVAAVRAVQQERYAGSVYELNRDLDAGSIDRYCPLSAEGRRLLVNACRHLDLSVRVFHRVKKVARTIADLEGTAEVKEAHISEAVCCRAADKRQWMKGLG